MLIIPNFKDVQRLLTGLQNQVTSFSYNQLVITQLAMEIKPPFTFSNNKTCFKRVEKVRL